MRDEWNLSNCERNAVRVRKEPSAIDFLPGQRGSECTKVCPAPKMSNFCWLKGPRDYGESETTNRAKPWL